MKEFDTVTFSKTIKDIFPYVESTLFILDIKANNEKQPSQGRINLRAGYLIASPGVYLKMVLFKDRKNNKDIIGIILGCSMPPIQYCDYGFLEFNNEKLEWTVNRDVFPWEDFNAKCNKLAKQKQATEEYFLPEI